MWIIKLLCFEKPYSTMVVINEKKYCCLWLESPAIWTYLRNQYKINVVFELLSKLELIIVSENVLFGMISIAGLRVRVMVFNATFNNISIISWRSVLLVEETGVPGETHRTAASHWQTLSHKVVSGTHHIACTGFELTRLVVIGTDCIGSYKSTCHTITTTTAPESIGFCFLVTYVIMIEFCLWILKKWTVPI